MRLDQLSYDHEGHLRYPRHHHRATETELATYLAEAQHLAAQRSPDTTPEATISADFDQLRWFELPTDCLT